MSTYFEMIPSGIKEQIREITKSSGFDYNDESLEMMAEAWIEKQNIFAEKIKDFGMAEAGSFEKDDPRGALLMTYSGSLVNIGPVIDQRRESEYTSIGLRSDVPDSALNDDTVLAGDAELDEILRFEKGPVSSTSQIFKIAIMDNENLTPEEAQETLKELTTIITDEFVDINKTIISNG